MAAPEGAIVWNAGTVPANPSNISGAIKPPWHDLKQQIP